MVAKRAPNNGRPAKRGGVEGQGSIPTQAPPHAEQGQTFGENDLVPDDKIELARSRARVATLEAELLAMRNEMIKLRQELQRRIDGEEEGNPQNDHKAGKVRKAGGRSSTVKPKAD